MGRLEQKQVDQLASLSSTFDVTPPHRTTGARGALIVSSPPIWPAVAVPVVVALCRCSRQAGIIPVQPRLLLLKVPHSFNMAHHARVRRRVPCSPASTLPYRHTHPQATPLDLFPFPKPSYPPLPHTNTRTRMQPSQPLAHTARINNVSSLEARAWSATAAINN